MPAAAVRKRVSHRVGLAQSHRQTVRYTSHIVVQRSDLVRGSVRIRRKRWRRSMSRNAENSDARSAADTQPVSPCIFRKPAHKPFFLLSRDVARQCICAQLAACVGVAGVPRTRPELAITTLSTFSVLAGVQNSSVRLLPLALPSA